MRKIYHLPLRNLKNLNAMDTNAELIFVTNITNYICGEKIVTWRNFGENLGNFEKFSEFLPQFTRFHVEKERL